MAGEQHRKPALDGLRGIAVLLVVTTHLWSLGPGSWLTSFSLDGIGRAGFLGVDVFFVLSGFLITDLLLREQAASSTISFRRFWRARALRILPALALLLSAYVVWNLVRGDQASTLASDATRNVVTSLTFTRNWLLLTAPASAAPELNHLWSLAVEEQFYLVWPFCVALIFTVRRRLRFVIPALLLVIAAVNLWRVWLVDHRGFAYVYGRTDARFDGLLVGALVAYLHFHGRLPRASIARWGAWVGSVVLAVALWRVPGVGSPFLYRGGFTLVAVATALIVVGVLQGPWARARLLTFRPLVVVGTVSYSLYLWHVFVFYIVGREMPGVSSFVRVIVGFGATAAAVAASWWVIERPARGLRVRLDRRVRTPVEPSPLWVRIFIGLGAVMLAGRWIGGGLSPTFEKGGALPAYSSMRSIAWMQLRGEVPRASLLADAVRAGGEAMVSRWHLFPAVVRVPVVALSMTLHPAMVGFSIILAWCLLLVSLRGAPTAWRGTVPFLAAFMVLVSPSPQISESWMWLLVAVAVAVRLGLVLTRSFGRRRYPQAIAYLLLLAGLISVVVLDAGTMRVAPAGTTIGWTLPAAASADQLAILGDCRSINSGPDGWSPADSPVLAVDLRFVVNPLAAGRAEILNVGDRLHTSVVVESDAKHQIRFVLLNTTEVGSPTNWFTPTESIVVTSELVDGGRTQRLMVMGHELGRLDNVSADRRLGVPVVQYADVSAQLHALVIETVRPNVSDGVCQPVLHSTLSAARVLRRLPAAAAPGSLVVIGRCTSIYSGEPLGMSPRWRGVEVEPMSIAVGAPLAPQAMTYDVVVDLSGTRTGVRVEADGRGRVRFHVGAPYVETVGPWLAPQGNAAHLVHIDFDPRTTQYLTFVDGTYLGTFPATGSVVAGTPKVNLQLDEADMQLGGPRLQALPTEPGPLCTARAAAS